MAIRVLVQVGPWILCDTEWFRYAPAGEELAGSGSVPQLAASELATDPDVPVGFGLLPGRLSADR